MTFYYRPTVTEAFASVQYIMTEANFGFKFFSRPRFSRESLSGVFFRICHDSQNGFFSTHTYYYSIISQLSSPAQHSVLHSPTPSINFPIPLELNFLAT
jgi:hypothetical protein